MDQVAVPKPGKDERMPLKRRIMKQSWSGGGQRSEQPFYVQAEIVSDPPKTKLFSLGLFSKRDIFKCNRFIPDFQRPEFDPVNWSFDATKAFIYIYIYDLTKIHPLPSQGKLGSSQHV